MTKHAVTILLVFIAAISLGTAQDFTEVKDELIMEEGTVLEGGERIVSQDNTCRLRLQRDGNLIMERLKIVQTYKAWVHSWTTGRDATSIDNASYHAILQDDGNLVVYRRTADGSEEPVYASNTGGSGSPSEPYQLKVDVSCRLRLYRGNNEVIWQNIKTSIMDTFSQPGYSDVLQKGEMLSLGDALCCDSVDYCVYLELTLLLQHDCNLVQFVGADLGDRSKSSSAPGIVWSSNSKQVGMEDCYMLLDKGAVSLYSGTYDKSLPQFSSDRPGKYWTTTEPFDEAHNADDEVYELQLSANGIFQVS